MQITHTMHTLLSMSLLSLTADWMVHSNASTRPAQLLMNTRAGSPADDTLRNVPEVNNNNNFVTCITPIVCM